MTYPRADVHRVIARLTIWPIIFAAAFWTVVTFGPSLEARFNPVIVGTKTTDVQRDGRKVCWTWSFTKLREAIPLYVYWIATAPKSSASVPIIVTRTPPGDASFGVNPLPVGKHETRLCTVLPDELSVLPDLTITGSVGYSSDHGLWVVWHPMSYLDVPAPGESQIVIPEAE